MQTYACMHINTYIHSSVISLERHR